MITWAQAYLLIWVVSTNSGWRVSFVIKRWCRCNGRITGGGSWLCPSCGSVKRGCPVCWPFDWLKRYSDDLNCHTCLSGAVHNTAIHRAVPSICEQMRFEAALDRKCLMITVHGKNAIPGMKPHAVTRIYMSKPEPEVVLVAVLDLER